MKKEISIIKFGEFRFNSRTGELFDNNGEPIKLQQQPARVLTLLTERAGEMVARDEIQKLLWADDTFVDFEQGVNYCVKQIRIALRDDAKTPKFVETLPRRGYRFIAPIKYEASAADRSASAPTQTARKPFFSANLAAIFGILLVVFLGTALAWNFFASTDSIGFRSSNPEAQDAYLKGVHLFEKGDPESVRRSLAFFDQAVHNDEKFALAMVARGHAFFQLGLFGHERPPEVFPKAERDARRALELNGTLAEAHVLLGSIAFRFEWNYQKAENHFRRALELDPHSANAHHDYAWFLASQSRFDEAVSAIEKAQSLEPTSVRTNIDAGWIYARARRYDQAVAQMKRTLDLEPENIAARQCLECAYYNKNMFAEAVENAVQLLKKFGTDEKTIAEIRAMEPKEALKFIEKFRLERMESAAPKIFIPAYSMAIQSAAADEKEKAFQYLEKALEAKDAGLVMFKVEQVWDKYRDDPRYSETLKKLGLS